jgi:hypothetical protein
MALTPIPYQALPFDVQENCTVFCAPWIQKIQRDDRTSFQFRFGACGNARDVLTNGSFNAGSTGWTTTSGWTFSGSSAHSPAALAGSIQQNIYSAANLYYELNILADINNGAMLVFTNASLLGVFTAGSGNYTISFNSTGVTYIQVFFSAPSGGSLHLINLRPINTRVKFKVAELDGTAVATIPAGDVTYSRGFLTVNIDDWDIVPQDGCYIIQAFDPCACSQYGFMGDEFEIPNQITLFTGSGVVGGGVMTGGNINFTPSTTVFRMAAAVCPTVAYQITYTLTGIAAGAGGNFRLGLGTAFSTLRTADGTYTETVTAAGTASTQDLRFVFNFNGVNVGTTITDFSIVAVTEVVTSESVSFELKETHGCTTTVALCGDVDQLGFGFGDTGFKPTVRLEGMYRGSGYPSVRETYRRATGRHSTYYGNQQKERLLSFSAPEYVQDFVSKTIVASHVYVNGDAVHCTADDAPTISYEDDFDLGHVQYPFVPSQQLIENRPCGTTKDIGCSTTGVILSINRTGGVPIGNTELTTRGDKLTVRN